MPPTPGDQPEPPADSHSEAQTFPIGPAADHDRIHIKPGDRLGPYTIKRFLGEGAFATVFEAAPAAHPHNTAPPPAIALKVIKPGMDSRAVIDRFNAERQALGRMQHPGIAKVFDGGLTAPDQGSRPYFAMEFIDGPPITDYCDLHRLPPKQRCRLFVQLCDAMTHAHARGIVHRDLKPSNVLVATDHHAKPQVKVIDFGIAKALAEPLTDATLLTEIGQLMGTPEYMSPEQADTGSQPIDVRTDVYAIGVMLYEILTGELPFDKRILRSAGITGLQTIIASQTPPTPSQRLDRARREPERLKTLMQHRDIQPSQLRKLLSRDLDHLVMQCLAKDPQRRYQTVADLADDLRRFLGGRRVKARTPAPSKNKPRNAASAPRQSAPGDSAASAAAWIVRIIAVLAFLGLSALLFQEVKGLLFKSRLGTGEIGSIDGDASDPLNGFQLPRSLPPRPQDESQFTSEDASPPTTDEEAASPALPTASLSELRDDIDALLELPTLSAIISDDKRSISIIGFVLNEAEQRQVIARITAASRTSPDRISRRPRFNFRVVSSPPRIEAQLEQWLIAQGDRSSTVTVFSNKIYIRIGEAAPVTAEAARAEAQRYVYDDRLVEVDE